MKKTKLFIIPALFIISLSAFALTACNPPESPQDKADWIVHKITTEFELNQDQIVKLNDFKNEILKRQEQHVAKKTAMIDKLVTELEKPSIDQNFFMEAINQIKTEVDESSPILIEKFVIFHESLTTEQKQKIVKMIKKHHQNHTS